MQMEDPFVLRQALDVTRRQLCLEIPGCTLNLSLLSLVSH
jgi:hypothetical protein